MRPIVSLPALPGLPGAAAAQTSELKVAVAETFLVRGGVFSAGQAGGAEESHPPAGRGRPEAPHPPRGPPGTGGPTPRSAHGRRAAAARGPLLTASRPLSCAPLARRASVLDLRSISSMMPWMWPPEIPWKSMAGGRKGHELSSARHPTISIYTRPRLSAHPREGAEARPGAACCRSRSAATLGDGGQEGQREEERRRRGAKRSAWKRKGGRKRKGKEKKKKKEGGKGAQWLPEDVQKTNKQGRREKGAGEGESYCSERDRVTNVKQLQRGEENKIWGRKKNSFEHKERKRSAIFSGPWLLASSQCL